MVARQLSQRGGEIRVQVESKRIRLQGKAVTVMEGQLLIN